jgi:uncharacterized membrane protein YqjE
MSGETTTATHASEPGDTPSLLRRVTDDMVQLVGRELALARSEANDKLQGVLGGVLTMVVGALLAHAALIILLLAVVTALDEVMPSWAAALIVGIAVALVGFVMVHRGERALEASSLAPTRTVQSLREDARMLKEQLP